MTEVIYHKNIYILLVDDVTLTVYKVMSLNIRSLLIKTLDRNVETLGHECKGPLMLYTHPDLDGPLLNFTLFLKLGSPSRLETRASCRLPRSLGGPVQEYRVSNTGNV